MQHEQSQIQSWARAIPVLRAWLLERRQDRHAAEPSETRRGHIGGGGKSEKMRTYDFRGHRVTDHRMGLTLYKLDKVLLGGLDVLQQAFLPDERAHQLGGEGDTRREARGATSR